MRWSPSETRFEGNEIGTGPWKVGEWVRDVGKESGHEGGDTMLKWKDAIVTRQFPSLQRLELSVTSLDFPVMGCWYRMVCSAKDCKRIFFFFL